MDREREGESKKTQDFDMVFAPHWLQLMIMSKHITRIELSVME